MEGGGRSLLLILMSREGRTVPKCPAYLLLLASPSWKEPDSSGGRRACRMGGRLGGVCEKEGS